MSHKANDIIIENIIELHEQYCDNPDCKFLDEKKCDNFDPQNLRFKAI